MTYQVKLDGGDFQAESIKELKDAVVDYCLHKRVREPHLHDFITLDDDGIETPLSLSVLRNEVDYEIECGWY